MARIALESPGSDQSVLEAVAARRGHFQYESGHHGDLWLDLDELFVNAQRMRGWASLLAERAARCHAEFVCGPLTGGAFLAQLVATEIGAGFVFAERLTSERGPVRYRLPGSLRELCGGKRILVVDDAINAGSAVLTTLADLDECGAKLAGLASLLTLGEVAALTARRRGVPLFVLAAIERGMWTTDDCPLCRAGMPLA